jgi:hypothetical protein
MGDVLDRHIHHGKKDSCQKHGLHGTNFQDWVVLQGKLRYKAISKTDSSVKEKYVWKKPYL